MDLSVDVTTQLRNAAFTFTNQANAARARAATALSEMEDPLIKNADPYWARAKKRESDAHIAVAEVWDNRARVAESGNLLFSPSESADMQFLNSFKDLINQCRNSGRIVYELPMDAALRATS